MGMRLTELFSWGRYIGHIAMSYTFFFSATATSPKRLVEFPLLVAGVQLLVDMHSSLGYYGWDKLLSDLHRFYW